MNTIDLDVDQPVSQGDLDVLDVGEWPEWRKKVTTRAVRVNGPFRVYTSKSENEPFYCEDGYLAVDARGYPYPVADDEFQLIYQEVNVQAGIVVPTLGRIVLFRSEKVDETDFEPGVPDKVAFEVPAVVSAVQATVHGRSVAGGHERDLDTDMHVHLVVFSPGDHTFGGDAGGTWQEFNVPYSEEPQPRTWAWPTRQ